MNNRKRYTVLILLLILAALTIVHVNGGKVSWPGSLLWKSITGFDPANQDLVIFREIRIPRTLMAVLAGAGLSISGLLMQTLFNNPLAGPSVLGITSGASLFVALTMMTGVSFFASGLGVVTAALLGAIVFSAIILLFSFFVRNQVSLLLIGMMLGSFTSAVIQVIQVSSHEGKLKAYTLWGFGSLQQVNFNEIPLILLFFVIALFSMFFLIKPLNLLVIGDKSTRLLGIDVKAARIGIIIVSSVFAGLITAYCGPISFIGLAVPNIVKIIYKTQNHLKLLLGAAIIGGIALLLCDLLVLWLEPYMLLPLNGVTALFGSPVVVWIILRKF